MCNGHKRCDLKIDLKILRIIFAFTKTGFRNNRDTAGYFRLTNTNQPTKQTNKPEQSYMTGPAVR